MIRFWKKCVVMIWITALLLSVSPPVLAQTGSRIRNPGIPGDVCTSLSSQAMEYYTGSYSYENISALSGAASSATSHDAAQSNVLYQTLYQLMSDTQTGSFSFNSLPADFAYTDCVDGAANSTMCDIWGGRTAHWDGRYFNREHIWPKSQASYYQKNGGSDRHHLRPASATINQDVHGHKPYGMAPGGIPVYNELHTFCGYTNDRCFEPADRVKGDVARILLYVYVRWQQPNLFSDLPAEQLPPMDPDDLQNDGGRVIESLDVLLSWIELDPVDTWEMGRNDAVERIQGNRNVFIDYPELAFLLFGKQVPVGMQTPTQKGCEHDFEIARQLAPTCAESGSVLLVCMLCRQERTLIQPAAGHIDGDFNGQCDRCGIRLESDNIFTLTDEWTDGDSVVIFHPQTGLALGSSLNGNDRITGSPETPGNGFLQSSALTAVFEVEKADDAYHLICGGYYLTSGENGNSLSLTAVPNEYSLWYTEPADDGGVFIRSKNAAYKGNRNQALEYWTDGFTVYGLSATEAFRFELYANRSHVHRWDEGKIIIAPSCDSTGVKIRTCLTCGETKTEQLNRLDHVMDAGVVKTEPTFTSEGVMTYTCVNCGRTWDEPIPKLTQTDPPVPIDQPCDGGPDCPGSAFTDMPPAGDWAHDPIDWAVSKEITTGTSAVSFSPEDGCTRAQVVTFLWRAAGRPTAERTQRPFHDVSPGAYYEQAVLWAVENGITTGTSEGAFSPEETCTRAQVVTFLWRFTGTPASQQADHPFADVPEAEYYFTAVLWAVENGVTNGSGAHLFSPEDPCTRAHVVTFLFRLLEKRRS